MAWTPPEDFSHEEIVTATKLNANLRDNMKEVWREVAYVEVTSNVSVPGSEAAPTDVVSSGAITYAATPILIEFFCPDVAANTNASTWVSLWDDTADRGRLFKVSADANGHGDSGIYAARRLTPTAASHTYKIRGWNAGIIQAGAGGVGTLLPGFIRIQQKGGA